MNISALFIRRSIDTYDPIMSLLARQ